MATIKRVERPTYDEFVHYYLSQNRPIRIVGAIDDWPAMRKWSFDYMAALLEGVPLSPVVLREGEFHIDLDDGVRVEEMSFATYAAHLDANDPPSYYLRLPLEGPFEQLFRSDYEVPSYCRKRVLLKNNIWIGGRGTASDIHFDMTHNLVAQVTGRRRVMLFGPEESKNLYPYPKRTLNWHHSQVRAEAPDFARFPKFREARPMVCDLEAGDMLFIPRGVWHRFETTERAIAINFFWLTKRLIPRMALARLLWTVWGVRT